MDVKAAGIALLLAALCPFLSSCPPPPGNSTTTPDGVQAAHQSGDAKAPGIEFEKLAVGSKLHTLDFVGNEPAGLAGSKQGGMFYMAAREGTDWTGIYSRDLKTQERKLVQRLQGYVTGSLASSSDGRYLVYCKQRFIDRYLDVPDIDYPQIMAIPYLYEVASGTETEMFNYRDPDWMPFRSNMMEIYLSPDGSRAGYLAYNIDRIKLDLQIREWLGMVANYQSPDNGLTSEQLSEAEELLRKLMKDSRVAPLLKELGVDAFVSGPITDSEIDAMQTIQQQANVAHAAVCLFENGNPRLLELQLPEATANLLHTIIGWGNSRVLLGHTQQGNDPTAAKQVYELDLESGTLREAGEYSGNPTTMELNTDETKFLIISNAIDSVDMRMLNATDLISLDLETGEAEIKELGLDLFGVSDLTTDGRLVFGQDSLSNDLYMVDVETGASTLLVKLLAQLTGVFIDNSSNRGVLLDSGITYAVDLEANPQEVPGWTAVDHFSEYEQIIRQFLGQIGYDVPAELIIEWEERAGLGEHEIAAGVGVAGQTEENIALIRYSLKQDRVVSLWFPTGIPFELIENTASANLDFYQCREIAERLIQQTGWLNPETMQLYQPGPNPLYDGRSQSFIVVFRDGYFLDGTENSDWVLNREAVVRVQETDGKVPEMTLSVMDEVQGQPLSVSPEDAAFRIRNQEGYAVPDTDIPLLRIDQNGYRLTVGQQRETAFGPALYNSRAIPRLCYEMDGFIMPEDELILTAQVDTETGEVLGQIDFMPSNLGQTGEIPGP